MFFLLVFMLYSTMFLEFCNCIEAIPMNKNFRRKITGKILGGSSTNIAKYPSIVAVLANDYHVCGGTIIGSTTVLTAAHCFTPSDTPVKYTLRANSTYALRGGTIYNIIKIMLHVNFENVHLSYDFAVAKTRKTFYGYQVAPLAKSPIPAGSTVQVAGWGLAADNKVLANLQHGSLVVLSENRCKKSLNEYKITKSMLCAISPDGKVDTCTGDSGGPLYYGNKVAGVTSWGIQCGDAYPGVYGNVSHVHRWLEQFL